MFGLVLVGSVLGVRGFVLGNWLVLEFSVVVVFLFMVVNFFYGEGIGRWFFDSIF